MKKPKINLSDMRTQANTFVGQWYRWFVLGVLLIVFVLAWFLILQREYIALRQSGIIGYEATIERLQDRQDYLSGLRQMEESYEELNQEQLRQLEYLLPTGFDVSSTIARMEDFARQSGLSLLSVDVVSGREVQTGANETTAQNDVTFSNKNIREASISMNLATDGSYEQLKRFLDTLDSFVPVLNLKSISYTPATASYAIQVQTYYIDESDS